MRNTTLTLLLLGFFCLSAKAQVYRNGLINALPPVINPAWTGYVFNHELDFDYYPNDEGRKAQFDITKNAHIYTNHRSQWTGLPQTINGSTILADYYNRDHLGVGVYASRQSAGTANLEEYYTAGLISYRLGGRERELLKILGGLQVGYGWSRLANASRLNFFDQFDLNGPTGAPTLDPVILQFESIGYYNFTGGLAVAKGSFYGGFSIRNFASGRSNRSLLNNFEDERLPLLVNLQVGNTFTLKNRGGKTQLKYFDLQAVLYKQEEIPGYLQVQGNFIAQNYSLGLLYSGTVEDAFDNSVFGAMVGFKVRDYSFRYLYTTELTGNRSTNLGSTHEFGLAYLFRIGTGPCRGEPMRSDWKGQKSNQRKRPGKTRRSKGSNQ